MKRLVFGIALATAFCAFAIEIGKQPTEEERQQQREKMLKATGGLLDVVAKGKVVVVNAQTKIPHDAIQTAVSDLAKATRYNIELRDGKLEMYQKPADANVAITLGECPDLPMSLVAAENCWGLLNVTPLVTDDAEKSVRRFQREFARVAAFTLGQSCSQYKGSPLCAVSKPEDLDNIPTSSLTFDAVASIVKMLKDRGMTQTRKTSYRKACEEGWAPAPTNENQKAIWDKVHAVPANPMKIEFDPKKGR